MLISMLQSGSWKGQLVAWQIFLLRSIWVIMRHDTRDTRFVFYFWVNMINVKVYSSIIRLLQIMVMCTLWLRTSVVPPLQSGSHSQELSCMTCKYCAWLAFGFIGADLKSKKSSTIGFYFSAVCFDSLIFYYYFFD